MVDKEEIYRKIRALPADQLALVIYYLPLVKDYREIDDPLRVLFQIYKKYIDSEQIITCQACRKTVYYNLLEAVKSL